MSDTINNQKEHIIKLLKEKSVMKQDVFRNTLAAFDLVKQCVNDIASDLLKKRKRLIKNCCFIIRNK